MLRLSALIAAPFLLGSFALAGTAVPVPHFTDLAARAGADVKLIYGPTQRVTVVSGDLKTGHVEVRDGHILDITGCSGMFCWGVHKFEVEVVTPAIASVSANSGADVNASGNFPKQAHLSAQAHSGGDVDVRAIPAETVDAQASSGGDARVNALATLNAQANSGGDVHYTGHPAHVNSQSNSGGDVTGD